MAELTPSLERARRLGHRLGTQVVQRVHPAFSQANFWRLPLDDQPHPLSPQGQERRLVGLYGEDLGRALLHTEVEEDEAFPREKLIANFLGNKRTEPLMRGLALVALGNAPLDNQLLGSELERLLKLVSAPPDNLPVKSVAVGPRKGIALKDSSRFNLPYSPSKKIESEYVAPVRKGDVFAVVGEYFNIPEMPEQYSVRLRAGPDDKGVGQQWFILRADLEVGSEPELKDFRTAPLFGNDGPSPGDIVQQKLGDCFVLAALGSIARSKPEAIRSMIADPESDAPAVRFFRRKARKPAIFEPEWVRVDKQMFVDRSKRNSIYAQCERVLWPALIEKAYAYFSERAWGYMGLDEGGHMSTVFEAILGREAQRQAVFDHPLELGDDHEALLRLLPDESDRKKLVAYVKKENLGNKIKVRADPGEINKVIAKAGLSEKGKGALKEHVLHGLGTGSEKTGTYSSLAEDMDAKIECGLRSGRVLGLGSKAWGEGGAGASGGENMEEVSGLASIHAYMVLDRQEALDGRRYVLLRNPWGSFGRGYSKKGLLRNEVKLGTPFVAPKFDAGVEIKGERIEGAEFWLELSDVVRYFDTLYIG